MSLDGVVQIEVHGPSEEELLEEVPEHQRTFVRESLARWRETTELLQRGACSSYKELVRGELGRRLAEINVVRVLVDFAMAKEILELVARRHAPRVTVAHFADGTAKLLELSKEEKT